MFEAGRDGCEGYNCTGGPAVLSELIIHDLLQNVFKPLPPREVVACVASAVGSALMLNVLLAAAVVPLRPLPLGPVALSASVLADRVAIQTSAVWPAQTSRERTPWTRSSAIVMQTGGPTDSYSVLGVKPGATAAQLKAAYRERAKRCHPDVNPSSEAAQEFQTLTEVGAHAPVARRHAVALAPHAIFA